MNVFLNIKYESTILYGLLILLVLIACNNQDQSGKTPSTKRTSGNQAYQKFDIKGNVYDSLIIPIDSVVAYDDLKFIPLIPDDNGGGLITNVQRIDRLEKNWIVYDASPSGTNLHVFGPEGNFLFGVGDKGRGPGEFNLISAFNINKPKRRIQIFDNMLGKLLMYDFQGNFIKEIRMNSYFSDFTYSDLSDRYLLFTLDCYNTLFKNDFPLESDYIVTVADTLFNPISGYTETEVARNAIPFYIGRRFNEDCDNTIYANLAYNNKFYRFDDMITSVSFEINIPEVTFMNEEDLKIGIADRSTFYTDQGYGIIFDYSFRDNNLAVTIRSPNSKEEGKFLMLNALIDTKTGSNILYKNLMDRKYNAFSIKNLSILCPEYKYDAFAKITPQNIEILEANDNKISNKLMNMLEINKQNPIIVLLNFAREHK